MAPQTHDTSVSRTLATLACATALAGAVITPGLAWSQEAEPLVEPAVASDNEEVAGETDTPEPFEDVLTAANESCDGAEQCDLGQGDAPAVSEEPAPSDPEPVLEVPAAAETEAPDSQPVVPEPIVAEGPDSTYDEAIPDTPSEEDVASEALPADGALEEDVANEALPADNASQEDMVGGRLPEDDASEEKPGLEACQAPLEATDTIEAAVTEGARDKADPDETAVDPTCDTATENDPSAALTDDMPAEEALTGAEGEAEPVGTGDEDPAQVQPDEAETPADAAVESEPAPTDETDQSGDEEATAESDAALEATAEAGHNMYRMYNPFSGEHLYTASWDEVASAFKVGWRYEGVGWVAPESGEAVYRLYNPYTGDHHYTANAKEVDRLKKGGWKYEGVAWYGAKNGVNVYREFNPYATVGTHNYTTSSSEDKSLAKIGWKAEGIAFKALSTTALPLAKGQWLVASSGDRTWVQADASPARSRIIDPSTARDKGAGQYSYATSTGYVVRGAAKSGDWVWLADAAGKLASGSGWKVTNTFGDGQQRYYLYDSGKGYARAKVGYSTDGYAHFTTNKGYVSRNDLVSTNGTTYYANNDGKLVSIPARMRRMVDAAKSEPATPHGYCALWVTNVIESAGLGSYSGNANDLYYAWCTSSNRDDLRPGMVLAVSRHGKTALGLTYGHICVYIGDGKVMHSRYGTVETWSLNSWISYYGDTVAVKWGWPAGKSLL